MGIDDSSAVYFEVDGEYHNWKCETVILADDPEPVNDFSVDDELEDCCDPV